MEYRSSHIVMLLLAAHRFLDRAENGIQENRGRTRGMSSAVVHEMIDTHPVWVFQFCFDNSIGHENH
jgi:hypothetical protein